MTRLPIPPVVGALRPLGCAMLAVGALGAVVSGGSGPAKPTTSLHQARLIATAPMTSDGDGTPMFSAAQLSPGQPASNCISVSVESGLSGAVLFGAEHVSGSLARFLNVTVSAGSGGRLGDCQGFTGGVFYSGSLNGLTQIGLSGLPGVTSPWTVNGGSSQESFQITVAVANNPAALAGTASADFVWELVSTTPPPTTTLPTTTSTSIPATTTTVAPTTTAAPTTSDGSGSSGRTWPRRRIALLPGDNSSGSSSKSGSSLTQSVGSSPVPKGLIQRLERTAVNVGREGPGLAVLAGVCVLFLALQDVIDRQDPKLAESPIYPEPDLPFVDLVADEDDESDPNTPGRRSSEPPDMEPPQ